MKHGAPETAAHEMTLAELLDRLARAGDRLPLSLVLVIGRGVCNATATVGGPIGPEDVRLTPNGVRLVPSRSLDEPVAPRAAPEVVRDCGRLLEQMLAPRPENIVPAPATHDVPRAVQTLLANIQAPGGAAFASVSELDAALAEVAARCFVPADPAMLGEYLRALQADLPGDGGHVSPTLKDLAARQVARRRTLRAGLAGIVLLGLAVLVWSVYQGWAG